MRKSKLLASAVTALFFVSLHAQVGINNQAPKATLEITAKNPTGISNAVEGLLIPRMDRERAHSMTGTPESTMIYVNSVATGSAAGTTVNMNETGYYYFDGSVWLRFNDVGVAPLTKAAFNGSGTYNDAAETVANGVVKKISFPAVNITADPEIGVWSMVNNEMTVSRKGVFTITASLLYEDCSNTTSAFLVIKAGNESETTANNILITPTPGTTGPFTQRNNLSASFVLNSGDKIWVEASRANLGWAVGKRSVNITFSETN